MQAKRKTDLHPLPIKAISLALLITVLLFLGTGLYIWLLFHEYSNLLVRDIRLQAVVEDISSSSDLTNIARRAATRKNPQLEEAYRIQSAEAEQSIRKIRDMAPDLVVEQLADRLLIANGELVEMENQAFALIRAGNFQEAEDLLYGAEYQNKITQFDEICDGLLKAVDHLVDSDIKDLKIKSYYLLLANSIALPILLWVWFSVVRMVKHHIEIREQMEERLREQSIRDGLTGLLNRRGFLMLAQQEMKNARETGKTIGILYADLDNLKQINDQFSHGEGDRALVETAQLFQDCFRITDIQGRLGGDEFVIFITGARQEELRDMMDRFNRAVETLNLQKQMPFRLSVSIGAAFCEPHNPITIEELLARADADMYEQKRKKKSGNPA